MAQLPRNKEIEDFFKSDLQSKTVTGFKNLKEARRYLSDNGFSRLSKYIIGIESGSGTGSRVDLNKTRQYFSEMEKLYQEQTKEKNDICKWLGEHTREGENMNMNMNIEPKQQKRGNDESNDKESKRFKSSTIPGEVEIILIE